jgi:putative dehydrogenase
MKKIAFIGLGSMGLPMASHLVKHGFNVHGFDINPTSLNAFEAVGGTAAHDLSQATYDAECLILMVINIDQARQILFEHKAADQLAKGACVCLMSTCPAEAVTELAAQLNNQGLSFADAPVSGGVAGAKAGSLTIMAAASQNVYAQLRPLFDAMGERIYHVGESPGQGAVVKTVNQLLCGVHIAVVAEAFSLAAKVGVDLKTLLEVMSGSAASSWMLKDRGPRMLESDPDITSAVDIFVKDLSIVLETGKGVQAALPLAAAAHQMFLSTSGRGDGKADDSQVIRSYHLLNGNQ